MEDMFIAEMPNVDTATTTRSRNKTVLVQTQDKKFQSLSSIHVSTMLHVLGSTSE